ncbi:DUF2341 domain-containing protein [Paenibacillus contaminans]|nr:DUF2341 domain-containing protein [Paenibacillus contaminans]
MAGYWPVRKIFRKLQLFVCALLVLAMLVPEASAAAEQTGGGNGAGAEDVSQSVYGSVYDNGPALPAVAGYTERDMNPAAGQLSGFGYLYGFQLDYGYRSIGIDLGSKTTFNTIELEVEEASNRVEKADLSLYISDDNLTYVKVKDWDFVKIGNKAILYNFSESARYVKVHNHFDDTAGTFYADNLQDMIKAYRLPPGRFTAGGGQSWKYRKPVTVSNPNSEALYDRAVYLTKAGLGTEELIAAGKLEADYRDVRFADAGGKELHYYMDDNGFFVRIPQLQAAGSETVYFAYGNPKAAFRGHAQEALQVEYGNKTLVAQDGEVKPLRLKDGTLMILAGSNDKGVTAKYSYDGGKNWTNPEKLVTPVSNSGKYEFPGGAYVDDVTGEVYLFFGVHYYFGVWTGGSTCLDINVCRNDMYFVKSTGFNGKKPMFGTPQQITGIETASGHPIHYLLSYTNPIRLSTGRLLEPFSYVIGDDGTFGVGFLYSDDDGASWHKSVTELSIPSVGGEGGVTEVAVIELGDGTVKTYMRQQRADLFYLGTSSSTDHGSTWSPVVNSDVMSTNTFPGMIRDGNNDILLTWSGHNAMGGGSYHRNNLTVAYSNDETATWQGYRDVLGRTKLSNPGWLNGNEARTVVQADKVPAGEDEWLFSWSGPNGVYSLLIEDFDRYLRSSHGALDDFEYEKQAVATDNGSRLANDYWWKSTDSGVVTTSNIFAKQGKRSLQLNDTVNDKKRTAASRLFPAARKASVQFSVYGASFANELYVSLQEGFSQNWNALGAGFILQVAADGKLKYTDTATDSSTTDTKVGFVNPDTDPTRGNLISIGDMGSFALDYVNRSVGADLGRYTKINAIKLTDSKQYNKPQAGGVLGNRINKENLEVYISNSNKGDWTRVDGWSYDKTDGNITIGLESLSVSARYIKVHQSYSDTGFTFGAPLQEIMTVITDQSAPVVFHELPTPTVLAPNEWNAIKIDYDLDAASADVYVNGVFKGAIADAHPGKTINHLMLSSGLGAGTNVFIDEVMIQDKTLALPLAGTVGSEEAALEGQDMTAPAVAFQPDGNESWQNAASSVVMVSDDWSGVDAAKLEYVWSQSETAPAAGWEVFANGTALTKTGADVSGDWYLHVRAADLAGNETAVRSKRFRLLSQTEWNPTAASIALTAPAAVQQGQPITVTGTVYNVEGLPLSGATVFLTASKGNIAPSAVTGADGRFTVQFQAPAYSGEIVVTAFVPGSSAFKTAAIQVAAIEEEDITPPTIVIQPDGNESWQNAASPVVTVSDDWSGVDAAKLEYAWSQSETAPATGWETFTNGTALTKTGADVSGDWYLHVRAADLAGNETAVRSKRFRLLSQTEWNPTAASIALTTPAAVQQGQPITVTGTVYDVEGLPLSGATVFLTASKGNIAPSAVTGTGGRFTVQFQAPAYSGEIVVTAFVPGSSAFKTAAIVVTTAWNGGDGGSGNNNSGSSGGGTSTPAPTSSPIVNVKPADLKPENGAVTVTLGAGKEGVSLPVNAADLIGPDAVLVIQTGDMKLEIPAGVLANTAGLLSESERNTGSILVKVKPVASTTQPHLAAGGQMFEWSIEAVGANNKTERLNTFSEPVTITLPALNVKNPKLSGIYFVDEKGKFLLIGGAYALGGYTVEVNRLGKYGVYEFTKTYLDVPESHWAYAIIQELSFKEIANGVTDGTFAPDQALTRAELTALLVRSLGLGGEPDAGASQAQFRDVKNGDWYAEAVRTAYALGLVQGTSEESFEPNRTVTREEMAVMIVRAIEKQTGETLPEGEAAFADREQISSWAQSAAGKAFKLKLIEGRAEGSFVPSGTATRAESAKLILLLIGQL